MTDTPQSEQKIMDDVAILSYVDQLIKERYGDKVPGGDELKKTREFLFEELTNEINMHLIGLLDDTSVDELNKKLEDAISDEELDDYLKQKIPNISTEIATALLNYRVVYLYDLEKEEAEMKKLTEQAINGTPIDIPADDDLSSLMPAPIAPDMDISKMN